MKIAFVYDAMYPWEKGGAQKRVWELARRLAEDHEVHCFGMQYWDGPPEITREGVTLHGVSPPYKLYHEGRRSIPQALRFTARLTGPLLRRDFDIIDCQQFPYFPTFPAKCHEFAKDSTLVVTWYEVWDDYWYDYLGWKGAAGKAVERAVARLPTHIVPISTRIRDDLATIGRSNRVTVVENGVDFDGLQAIEPSPDDWDVVYVGRLAEHKNVNVLLDAVASASDRLDRPLQTCIIGDGPERDELQTQAEKLGIADYVRFAGFIECDDEVIATLASATVFALPSTREGFPNTILEANACGVPSIVVDHPENGATSVVEDGETGLLAQTATESFTDCLVNVLTDEALRERLSSGARAYGKAHDWAEIVNELEAVYQKVNGSGGGNG